jgi:AAA domain
MSFDSTDSQDQQDRQDALDKYRFSQWRRLIATMPDTASKLETFQEAADDIAAQFSAGRFAKPTGVDELVDMAQVHGLTEAIGQPEVERIVGEAFTQAKPPQSKIRFKLERFDDVKPSTAPNYLVKGIIPRHGMTVIWGPPKCGKSFWTLDLTMHIALGDREYRGHKVKQGAVVYLAPEGGGGFRNRIEAWRQRYLGEHSGEVPFYLLPVPIDLIADHKQLIHDIGAQVATPAIVIIDTLNRSLNGSENDSKDMAKYIRAADMIRCAFDCAIGIVHHCGLAGDRPRGHTSLSGAADAQIAVERDASGLIITKVEHMKDGEAGAATQSRLHGVGLGHDDDGDEITSCVIVSADHEETSQTIKLKGDKRRALDALRETIINVGKAVPNSRVPTGQNCCPIEAWRTTFLSGKMGNPDKPDSRRRAFVRAAEALQELRIIGISDDLAWLVGQTRTNRTRSFCPADSFPDNFPHTLEGAELSGSLVRTEFRSPISPTGTDEPRGSEEEKSKIAVRIIGDAPPGSTCIHCHRSDGDGEVKRIRRSDQVGSKTETLHEGCAQAWFERVQS